MLFSRCRRKLTENVVVHFLLPKAWFLAHQSPWSQGRSKERVTEDMDTWTPLCLSSQGGLLDSPSTWLTSCSLCGRELPHHRWKSPFLSRRLDHGPVLSVTPGTSYDISFSLIQSRQRTPPLSWQSWDCNEMVFWFFWAWGRGQTTMTHSFLRARNSQAPRTWISSFSIYLFFFFLQEIDVDLWLVMIFHLSMVADTCNASTWGLRQENWEFEASLGAKVKLCLKKLFKIFTQNEFDFLAMRRF